MKLDTMVMLIKHHLEEDNCAYIGMSNDEEEMFEVLQDETHVPYPDLDKLGNPVGPDKILVYSAFPMNGSLIRTVSVFYKFFTFELTCDRYSTCMGSNMLL